MTGLTVRVPKRPRSPEAIQAYTPKNGTKIELQIGSPVGQGAYGEVYSATCEKNGRFVIKRPLSTSKFRDIEECRKSLRNEKTVYDHLKNCDHVIGYHASTPRGSLVMERVSKKMTEEIAEIKKNPDDEARADQTLSLISGMLKALLCLRKKDYTHNDAHINNWMVNPPSDVKLIDFGMAGPCKKEGLVHYSDMLRAKKRGMLLYRKQHPAKAVQHLVEETETETKPAVQKILNEVKKIFFHDLVALVHEKYEERKSQTPQIPPKPEYDFYREMAVKFLSDINRVTGEMLQPESEEAVRELTNDLYEHRNLNFEKGKTAKILEEILNDTTIFPKQNSPTSFDNPR